MGRSSRTRVAAGIATGVAVTAGLGLGTASAAAAATPFEFIPGFYAKAVTLSDLSETGETATEVTQAGAHPDALMINFEFETGPGPWAPEPGEAVRDVEIELPPGMSGSPEAVPKCTMDQVETLTCPPASVVGIHEFKYNAGRSVIDYTERSAIYNVVPPPGVAARFAMKVLPVPVVFDMRVNSDGRYTITSKIKSINEALMFIGSRTFLFGTPNALNGPGPWKMVPGILNPGAPSSGPKIPMLTLGTECGAPQPVKIRARSWSNPSRWIESSYTPSAGLSGCDKLAFRPKLDLRPSTPVASTPSGLSVRLDVPQTSSPTSLATPNVRKVEVDMPDGVAINPASVHGLVGCSDEQATIRSLDEPSCPAASRIGTVKIETPVLAGPLEGSVYLGAPKSMDAQTGEMFRVFLVASGYGVTIKQEGKITPDPVTGRLRAVFDNAPQQPFSSMQINFNDGPRAPLAIQGACGTFNTTAKISSWAGQSVESLSSFEVACRDGLGAFSPSFVAGTANPLAGAAAPFSLSISKPDGQSPLNGVSLTLPKGLLANLKGNIGQQVGTATAISGLGSAPFPFAGKVYLEGAYGDAPFSLKVVVPTVAGPYDLGDVVVKQKLYVDPNDAHVTVVSDPLPTILQGVPVQLQRLDVSVDKPAFMINPTSCEASSIGGTLSSSTGQTAPVSVRFQVGGCGELDYAPKLSLAISGELRNGGHPQLVANLKPGKGEANQRKAQVTLPLNLALDPDNAKALCEPAAAASNSCPAESIVGSAKAVSILDVPLEGPVYFVRGERTSATGKVIKTLPKLFIPLSGQGVTINVRASSDVVNNRLQTTFDDLPDAPIEDFVLSLNGGSNGILKVTNGDVCKSTVTPAVMSALTGQNGRVFRQTQTLSTGCGFGVVKTVRKGNRVTVTAGGLSGGGLTVSGKGFGKSSRTVGKSTTVASVGVSLNAASRRALKRGKTVRLRVKTSFKASGKGTKTVSKTTTLTVKPAKKR